MVARVFGSARPRGNVTSAFGSAAPPSGSRGRWYLKLRPTSIRPFASNAEASVVAFEALQGATVEG